MPEPAPVRYVLLTPAAYPVLQPFPVDDFESGYRQTVDGGYAAFRLLVRIPPGEGLTPPAPVPGPSGGLAFTKGDRLVLTGPKGAQLRSGERLTLFAVMAGANPVPQSRRKVIVVEVVAIGFADYGEARALRWSRDQVEFPGGAV